MRVRSRSEGPAQTALPDGTVFDLAADLAVKTRMPAMKDGQEKPEMKP